MTPEILRRGYFEGCSGDLAIGLAPAKEQTLGRGHVPVAVPELAPVGRLPLPSSRPGAKKSSPVRTSLKPPRRHVADIAAGFRPPQPPLKPRTAPQHRYGPALQGAVPGVPADPPRTTLPRQPPALPLDLPEMSDKIALRCLGGS